MAKVLVSFDDRLLSRIDRSAKAHGLTRSAYLAALAERDIVGSGPGASQEARAAMRVLDGLFADGPAEESTVAIRTARDAR